MELAMKVNLKKIAAEAGVSIMTVSRALHDRPGVSRELRKKILEIADKFNYLPRRSSFQTAAGNLKSQAAALVLPEIESDFFSGVCRGVSKSLGENGYRLFIGVSFGSPTAGYRLVGAMLDHGVDGLIYFPVDAGRCACTAEQLKRSRRLVVMAGENILDTAADILLCASPDKSSVADGERAGRMAADMLLCRLLNPNLKLPFRTKSLSSEAE